MNPISGEGATAPLSRGAASGTMPAVRGQAAFVRALLDELERSSTPDTEDALCAQLAEELSRLGGRCLELANELAASCPPTHILRRGAAFAEGGPKSTDVPRSPNGEPLARRTV